MNSWSEHPAIGLSFSCVTANVGSSKMAGSFVVVLMFLGVF